MGIFKQHKPSSMDGPVYIKQKASVLFGAIGNATPTEIVG